MEANTDDGGRCILHNGDCSDRSEFRLSLDVVVYIMFFAVNKEFIYCTVASTLALGLSRVLAGATT